MNIIGLGGKLQKLQVFWGIIAFFFIYLYTYIYIYIHIYMYFFFFSKYRKKSSFFCNFAYKSLNIKELWVTKKLHFYRRFCNLF